MGNLNINIPCQVGDKAWVIDKDANDKYIIYEARWTRVTLVQTKRDGEFELRGEIIYQIPDCFEEGKTMPYGMYVGQSHTKVGERVFLTEHEAKEKLNWKPKRKWRKNTW